MQPSKWVIGRDNRRSMKQGAWRPGGAGRKQGMGKNDGGRQAGDSAGRDSREQGSEGSRGGWAGQGGLQGQGGVLAAARVCERSKWGQQGGAASQYLGVCGEGSTGGSVLEAGHSFSARRSRGRRAARGWISGVAALGAGWLSRGAAAQGRAAALGGTPAQLLAASQAGPEAVVAGGRRLVRRRRRRHVQPVKQRGRLQGRQRALGVHV